MPFGAIMPVFRRADLHTRAESASQCLSAQQGHWQPNCLILGFGFGPQTASPR